MTDAIMAIAISDIRPACTGEPDILKRIKKAFVRAQDLFLSTDDTLRFNASMAAILLETTDEAEKRRLIGSNKVIQAIEAMRKGLDVALPEMDGDPLPLIGLWLEAKSGAR